MLFPFLVAAGLLAGAPTPNRPPLQPNAYNPLPLTAVKPTGWLLNQLKLQAKGLTGHLDEFWPDVGSNSAWLGGTGEGWERGPYYLDGLLPLAYLINDQHLIAKANKWVEWTLTHQSAEGWLGPAKNKDWWPNFVMLKVLTQYQEATGDPRVIPAMQKYFAYQAKHLDEDPLKEWAIYRWQDEALSVIWLYNRTGDKSLLDLVRKLHTQGKDWEAQFANFKYTYKVAKKNEANLDTHGVNNAMAFKAAAVWSLITGNNSDREALYRMFSELDKYHGLPSGIFSSDEHYAGTDPSQGTELCTVVEAMFSLETDLSILGDAALGDRLEKLAYNALPATITPDFWAHQYDQQPNQVMCSLADRQWSTNGPDSNIFGLEPNFGCCTANMHQGWPKFASHLWMATPAGGLALMAWGPSRVTAPVHGTQVIIDETTDYPFRESATLAVNPDKPVSFDLQLRIPSWAEGAEVTVGNERQQNVRPGAFYTINRVWNPGDLVTVRLPMRVRLSTWANNSRAVERGPLIYSLGLGESWREEKQFGPSKDWELFPTTPWNYALVLNTFEFHERAIPEQPFKLGQEPVYLTAKGRRVPEWNMVESSAGPIPQSPVQTKQPEENLTLVPYGAAKLRITAFPFTTQ